MKVIVQLQIRVSLTSWGNITAGLLNLFPQTEGAEASSIRSWLSFDVIIAAMDTKILGNTAAVAVWLDLNKTTPIISFQVLLNSMTNRDIVKIFEYTYFLNQ